MQEYFLLFYIGIIGILGFTAFKLSDPIIDCLDKLSVIVANYIDHKVTHQYLVLFIDIIFILTVVIPIVFYAEYLHFINYPFIFPLLLLLMRFVDNIRRKIASNHPNQPSLITFVHNKLTKWIYFNSRFLPICEQFFGILAIFAGFYLTVYGISISPRPEYIYLVFLFIPLSLAFWVYLTPSLKFQEEEKILKARKFITYCALILIALCDAYNKISIEVLNYQPLFEKEISLLLSTIIVIYIPLDRVLNLWRDDLKKFNNP